MRRTPSSWIFRLAVGVFFLAAASGVSAQGPGEEGYTGPRLEIPVPGVEFSGMLHDQGILYIPWLGQYLGGVYSFLISIVGLVAAAAMIVGGFEYVTAAGEKSKIAKATKRMTDALAGLVLVFGSYVILYAINPDLTKFEALKVASVRTEPLEETLAADEAEYTGVVDDEQAAADTPPASGGSGTCTSRVTATFVSVKGATGISGNGDINTVTAESYKKVAAELYAATKGLPGGPYSIKGTGQRPLGERGDSETCKSVNGVKNRTGYCKSGGWSQVFKWETKCLGKTKCAGAPICNPYGWDHISKDPNGLLIIDPGACPVADNCPHTTGSAVDIVCTSSAFDTWHKANYTDSRGNPESPSAGGAFYAPCQLLLEKIMYDNGWCRLSSEAWHFEKPRKSGAACATSYSAISGKQSGGHDYSACKGVYDLNSRKCIPVKL